ncbi:MAG: hypothetical protein PSV16_11395 [Flavobacterium sp.]|nr:hypothetical protein [Flavobacterium sp.]
MKNLFICLAVFLAGCSSQNAIELEVLTKEINCKNVKLADYPSYMKMDTIAVQESRTIIVYKLTNNSDKNYYFNFDGSDFKDHYIKINKALLSISDSAGKNQKPHLSFPSGGSTDEFLYLDYLNYNYMRLSHDSKNFILHARETLYFEWFIVLPFGNMLEDVNYSVVLDPNKKYYAEVLVNSDSTNFKSSISRTDLKTIQDNGYEVFNGTIKSKNKIPIVFH